MATKSDDKSSKTAKTSTSAKGKSTTKSSATSSKTTAKKPSASSSKKTSAKTTNKQVVESNSPQSDLATALSVVSAVRSGAEQLRKKPKWVSVLAVIIIIALVCFCIYGYYCGWFDFLFDDGGEEGPSSSTYDLAVIKNERFSVHFLQLGNNYTGDCVYVKAGETDILIDAGSRQNSAKAIKEYVDKFCTDGVLEYVIATHAHQDHIAGFVGTKSDPGVFEAFTCQTIIQFALTNASTSIYSKYVEARDEEVLAGAKLYTALQCVNGEDGAQKVYDLTGNGEITMEILYQKFYENTSSDENNYSVCLLFTQGDKNYLFTGDLEKDGENSLVENNDLPQVELFKGGHHGSYTASNDVLLSEIKPKVVCICCCAGSIEYTQNLENTFPAQAFIDRVAKYTDCVYVTTMGSVSYSEDKKKYVDVGFSAMNGDIVFACTNGVVTMYFSDNDTKLKDTDWFKNNRQTPEAWK